MHVPLHTCYMLFLTAMGVERTLTYSTMTLKAVHPVLATASLHNRRKQFQTYKWILMCLTLGILARSKIKAWRGW